MGTEKVKQNMAQIKSRYWRVWKQSANDLVCTSEVLLPEDFIIWYMRSSIMR